MSMYGTTDAAANWAAEYGATLVAAGYVQGIASPCIFHNVQHDSTIMVHGEEFVGVGNPIELGRIRAALEDKYKLKVETLSGDKADVQEVQILNKIIRWTDRGVELEADPRHAEIVVRELGLEGATPSKVPGAKVDGNTDKPMPKDDDTSIQQRNIDAGAARTIHKNRQKVSASASGRASSQAMRRLGLTGSRLRGSSTPYSPILRRTMTTRWSVTTPRSIEGLRLS
jgi:hypothetical protein